MIAVTAAHESELFALRLRLSGAQRFRDVRLVRTGMGRAQAERSVRRLLECGMPLDGLLSIGFCGGLSRCLGRAAVVLADPIVATGKAELRPEPSWMARAAGALSRWSPHRGRLWTSARIVAAPNQKRELGQREGAIAVDMESYWVARLAAAHYMPFLALRIVLDEVDEWLPFGEARSGARNGRGSKPLQLLETVRWGIRTFRTAIALANAVEAVLRAMPTATPQGRREERTP